MRNISRVVDCGKVFLVLTLAAVAFNAVAQDYPNKTIHFIVPYPSGGASDVVARLIGQKMASPSDSSLHEFS